MKRFIKRTIIGLLISLIGLSSCTTTGNYRDMRYEIKGKSLTYQYGGEKEISLKLESHKAAKDSLYNIQSLN